MKNTIFPSINSDYRREEWCFLNEVYAQDFRDQTISSSWKWFGVIACSQNFAFLLGR